MKTPSGLTRDALSLPDRLRSRTLSVVSRLVAGRRLLRELGRICPDASRRFGGVAGQSCLVVLSGAAPGDRVAVARQVAMGLGRPLQIADKYIGETEKNLDRALQRAGRQAVVLFFDEADALFGRHTRVADANDRYANLETTYLLQRIETYPGIVVLSTNNRENIDYGVRRKLILVDLARPDRQAAHDD